MGENMKGFIFVKNTVILTATALILRTVGMFFKIWISGKIGAEGVGLYQLVSTVYLFCATFASTGISTGVTKLISEQRIKTRKSVNSVVLWATLLTLGAAAVIGVLVEILSPFISKTLIGDMDALPAVRIFCLALPFKGTAACVKGYFYAVRKSTHPAVSQLFEQAVRIIVISFCISRLGVATPYAVQSIVIGDIISEAASLVYIYIAYKKECKRLEKGENPPEKVLCKLLEVALPTAGSKYITSGLHTIESLLVPAQLTLFTLSREESVAQFGMLKGMALPLLFFPAAFLSATAILLIPETAEAAAEGRERKIREITERTVGITLTLGILIGGIFFMNANELGVLIFNSKEVGYMIRLLAPIVPFMYLESIADGILKGLNLQKYSLIYNVCDSSVRILAIFIFLRRFGMLGFLGVMIVSNITTSSLNTRRLMISSKTQFKISEWVIKPLAAVVAGVMLSSFLVSQMGLEGIFKIIVSSIITGVIFGVGLIMGGVIGKNELNFGLKVVKKGNFGRFLKNN